MFHKDLSFIWRFVMFSITLFNKPRISVRSPKGVHWLLHVLRPHILAYKPVEAQQQFRRCTFTNKSVQRMRVNTVLQYLIMKTKNPKACILKKCFTSHSPHSNQTRWACVLWNTTVLWNGIVPSNTTLHRKMSVSRQLERHQALSHVIS